MQNRFGDSSSSPMPEVSDEGKEGIVALLLSCPRCLCWSVWATVRSELRRRAADASKDPITTLELERPLSSLRKRSLSLSLSIVLLALLRISPFRAPAPDAAVIAWPPPMRLLLAQTLAFDPTIDSSTVGSETGRGVPTRAMGVEARLWSMGVAARWRRPVLATGVAAPDGIDGCSSEGCTWRTWQG
jgi:hypothetical protein